MIIAFLYQFAWLLHCIRSTLAAQGSVLALKPCSAYIVKGTGRTFLTCVCFGDFIQSDRGVSSTGAVFAVRQHSTNHCSTVSPTVKYICLTVRCSLFAVSLVAVCSENVQILSVSVTLTKPVAMATVVKSRHGNSRHVNSLSVIHIVI